MAQIQRKCWCVNVTEDICPEKSLRVFADRVEITAFGDLIFWIDNYTPLQTLAIANKKWLAFFEVSSKGMIPVNVDFAVKIDS